jgi:hypothetical protein
MKRLPFLATMPLITSQSESKQNALAIALFLSTPTMLLVHFHRIAYQSLMLNIIACLGVLQSRGGPLSSINPA